MVDLLEMQKYFVRAHLNEGDTAVDFTMGNGHDTLFLSKTVGRSGKVFAFDIQSMAIENTTKLLKSEDCFENCSLIHDSHHNVKKYVTEPVKAGMFNLGYMPGSGNKSLTTMRETTIPAVTDAISLLAPNGILLIAIYPGHREGEAEGIAIEKMLSELDVRKICVSKFRIINSPSSPYFMIAETK